MGKPPSSSKSSQKLAREVVGVQLGRFAEPLAQAAVETSLSRSDLLRLCVEVALPQVRDHMLQIKGRDVRRLVLNPDQLEDLRALMKSGVTDYLSDFERLEGADFVAAVKAYLERDTILSEAETKRVGRFLGVYAQLF